MVGAVLCRGAVLRLVLPVTGYGGTTAVAEPGRPILDRQDQGPLRRLARGRDALGIPPAADEMDMRIGETGLAFYEAYNPTDRVPIAGTASYNVSPDAGRRLFHQDRLLLLHRAGAAARRAGEMPVTFYVDPGDRDDPEGQFVRRSRSAIPSTKPPLPEAQAAAGRHAAAATAATN
jgi:cytochrome c oxidase assembly protein subunit 11